MEQSNFFLDFWNNSNSNLKLKYGIVIARIWKLLETVIL